MQRLRWIQSHIEESGVCSRNGINRTASEIAIFICSHTGATISNQKCSSKRLIMRTADTFVRARIDSDTKARAADALEAMGLSVSDAIRLLMLRVADERRLPFDVKVPTATTRKATAELEAGKGKHRATLDDMLKPVLIALVADQPLETGYRDHDLSRNWAGYRECHVKPDLLLIYRKADAGMLRLARLGSHSALFG